MKSAPAERPNADALPGVDPPYGVDGYPSQNRAARLQLHDDRNRRVTGQDLRKRRHTDATPPKGKRVTAPERVARVCACQFRARLRRDGAVQIRRAVEGSVMMYNRHAVAREVHVNLEAVGPKRQPEI